MVTSEKRKQQNRKSAKTARLRRAEKIKAMEELLSYATRRNQDLETWITQLLEKNRILNDALQSAPSEWVIDIQDNESPQIAMDELGVDFE